MNDADRQFENLAVVEAICNLYDLYPLHLDTDRVRITRTYTTESS
jgi:hypothetical protein